VFGANSILRAYAEVYAQDDNRNATPPATPECGDDCVTGRQMPRTDHSVLHVRTLPGW
jgi:hypothetical protein